MTLAVRLVQIFAPLPRLVSILYAVDLFPFLAGLTFANLALAAFNLIPVYPLDGGQITRGLLKLVIDERRADLILLLLSLPLALGIAVLGLAVRDVIVLISGLLMILAALTLHPGSGQFFMLAVLYIFDRAGFYLKRSDFDAAVREYTRAIRRNPNHAGLYVSRAVAHMNCLDHEAARVDIQQALAVDANHALAWTLLGELRSLERKNTAALDAYNRAVALNPDLAIAYLDRGELYQDLGRLEEAARDMDRALELGKGSPIVYLLRSRLRFQAGRLSGSRADADAALHYAPQWMLVFPEIFLENFRGYLSWAMNYYNEAVRRMPGAYQAYQGRADACRVNNRLDWALADYHRAIALAPRQGELYLNRGRIYLRIGKGAEAANDFRAASQLASQTHIQRQAAWLFNQAAAGAASSPETAPAE